MSTLKPTLDDLRNRTEAPSVDELTTAVAGSEDYRVELTTALRAAGVEVLAEWEEFDYWRAWFTTGGRSYEVTVSLGDADWPAGWYLLPKLEEPYVDNAGNVFDYDVVNLDPATSLGLPVLADPVEVAAAALARVQAG